MFAKIKSAISTISVLIPIILVISGYVVIEVTTIKVYDRKITDQHYNYYDGTYEWNEVKTNMDWEDGIIAVNPDYKQLLQKDLNVISKQYDFINDIDLSENIVRLNNYDVKICLEDQKINITDSTLMKKIVRTEFSAFLELYDNSSNQLLHKLRDRRFIIENNLLSYGFAKDRFLENKAVELAYVDIVERIPDFIESYEIPRLRIRQIQGAYSFINLFFPQSKKDDDHFDVKPASVELNQGE